MKTYIQVEVKSSGQPRPYADHEYIQELTFQRDDGRLVGWLIEKGLPLIRPYYIDRTTALAVARIFCPYLDPSDPSAHQCSRYLVSFDRLEPTLSLDSTVRVDRDASDRWQIHVRAAFSD